MHISAVERAGMRALNEGQKIAEPSRYYFFLPEPKAGCHPAVFWLGAAAIVLIFSFLGFLASRLLFCSPLAMPILSRFDE